MKKPSGAGGCGAGDCKSVVRGVSAHYVCDYGYEAFGGGDYPIVRDEGEGYHDGGGGVDSSGYEKMESGSGG